MAKKPLSISNQIVFLETDLEKKNAELKMYEKLFDRYLKYTFGMDRKEIESLIQESKKPVMLRVTELPAATEGVSPSAF